MILRTSSGSGGSRRDRPAQRAGVVRRVLGDVGLPLVGVDEDVVDERARHLDVAQRQRCRGGASWRTWAMTMPPLLRAAIAIDSISPWTASPSIVRLPSSSAVVPRITATSIGNAWNSSHSSPRSVTTSTRSSVVRAFCLPPVWRGSTYVPEADVRDEPRPAGGDLAHQLAEHALRERVRLELVRLDERAEARLVADVAADRPLHRGRAGRAGRTRGRRSRRCRRCAPWSGRAAGPRPRRPRPARR